MAGFKTHISTSGLLGVAYGGVALAYYDVPLPTCVLAGGLCAVSGMLPDLDSDSGVPLRESVAFASAVAPMLMIERFKQLGMAPETIVLAGALVYLLIRFGLASLLRRYTVHRGMFHSLPAAIIAAQVAYLLCCTCEPHLRLYKAGGVFLGFMSHLLLDEVYSFSFRRGRVGFKKSFGTALKVWGKSPWGNISTYGKLAMLTYVVMHDATWMEQAEGVFGPPTHAVHSVADHVVDHFMTR